MAAIDIAKANSGEPIKHGTVVVKTGAKGGDYGTDKYDGHVINTPAIEDIEYKYDERLDDPRYYTGDTPN